MSRRTHWEFGSPCSKILVASTTRLNTLDVFRIQGIANETRLLTAGYEGAKLPLVGFANLKTPAHRKFQDTGFPLLVWTLVVVVLVGGLPMFTGIVVSNDSKPAFALDLCHHPGRTSYNLSQSEAPLIPTHSATELPRDFGAAPDLPPLFFPRVSETPDPPPPKIGA